MYTALYRKWRPKAFADVIGQNHITETLKNEIKTNRLSHAYLFIGSRGTGKTTCARILAKAVNCPHVHEGEPCNACEICKGIDQGTVLDITEIDAASNNGVDSIRDLREQANFNPAQTKYRVYIIDEVHMLSQGAFNALLKTLEEPPEHVKFILATTEAHKMPATILSRCQRFDFKRIGAEVMSERLLMIAEKEGISLTVEAANLIARLSDGAMRDALSIMDQCIAGSTDINTKLVSEVCGIAGKEYLAQTASALLHNQSDALLGIISNLYENACDMERYCAELINYFRNVMVARAVKQPEKLIICSDEEMNSIKRHAEQFTLPRTIFIISALQETYAQIKSGVQGRTAMEMVLIKLASPEMDTKDESVLKRIAVLEQQLQSGNITADAVRTQAQIAPVVREQTPVEPAPEEEVAAPGEQTDEVVVEQEPKADTAKAAEPVQTDIKPLPQWPEIMQALFPVNRLAWTILSGTTAKVFGTTIIICGTHPSIPDILAIKVNSDDVLSVAASVTGMTYTAVISQKDADSLTGAPVMETSTDPLSELIEKAAQSDIEIEFI